MDGHRVAFNRSLTKMGYECTQFPPPVYNDLLHSGDGTAEGLVTAYFKCAGWPQMLATSDQPRFVEKICQGKALELTKMLQNDQVPLRPSVEEVISDALKDSFQVALISGTTSDQGDEVAASVLRQLGSDIASKVRVFNASPSPGEREGEEDSEMSEMRDLGALLSAAAAKEKAKSAAEFVSAMQQTGTDGTNIKDSAIVLDQSLTTRSNRRAVTPELIAALAATLGVRISKSILIAANLGVTQAGCSAGLMTVAVPRKLALQGTYPGVVAKVEGYGAGYATWNRLSSMLKSKQSSQ
ncbi:hypothetical protein CEUSTIGMA_g5495.t1 [Chlamydomonas eustigma]|uniref:Uncharacterized protein n=1 Tax=Chlamydomonas eustigma TaxID=1157962 RepID=A0A250X4P9_9CHLO|nr:hypothetical protein CEUSTIGMA_g5495.t1 [Chlamydomonas eustigma]|eukprot:GAX78053.1 hypothetical protein CEUSTIGMA_g5495.t1 [Chlamydomonas eustigma]